MDSYLLIALGLGFAATMALYLPFRMIGRNGLSAAFLLASAALGVLAYHLTLLWVFGVYAPSEDALWLIAYAMLFVWDLIIAFVVLLVGGAIGRQNSAP